MRTARITLAAWSLATALTLPVAAQTSPDWASPEALALLTEYGIELNDINRDKLLALDRKSQAANGQLDVEELDLTGDASVSRKEIQFVLSWSREQLATEGRYQLSVQPRLLPNRTLSGTVQLHANNPEQIREPGLLFDSGRLKDSAPLALGIDELSKFEVYAYVNYHPMRNAYADKPGPDGQPLTSAWYVLALHNPPDNPPVSVKLSGSGLINDSQSPHALQMLGTLPVDTSVLERAATAGRILHATRSQDADLQQRVLTGQGQSIESELVIQPGKSMLVYRELPLKTSGDYRGQYSFELDAKAAVTSPLRLQTAVVHERPAGPAVSDNIWNQYGLIDLSPTLKTQLSTWIEPRPDGKTEFLKPASDLSHPQALAAELRRVQLPAVQTVTQEVQALWNYLDNQPAELPAILRKGTEPIPALAALKTQNPGAAALLNFWITPAEMMAYQERLTALADRLDQAESFDETLLGEVRAWNAELKMIPRVLVQPDQVLGQVPDANLKTVLKAFEHRFWGTLVALGRINGVVPGQVIRSNLPAAELVLQPEDERREWNYLLISNPLNTGGVLVPTTDGGAEDDTDGDAKPEDEAESAEAVASFYVATDGARIDSMPMLIQSGNTLSPPPVDYGHYGVRYVVSGTFSNDSGKAGRLDVRFGSTDEMGHLDWRSLFDHSDSLMGDASTRFTGTIRVRSLEEGKVCSRLVSMVHGRVQSPQTLLADPFWLEPGEQRELSVELVVPTNSTGPQLLQFRMEKMR